MTVRANVALVRRLWTLFQGRHWDEAEALLHPDVIVEWPHTRERMRGRDNFLAVQRHYPEPWSIEVRRVIGSGDLVVAEVAVTHPGGTSYCASFAEIADGQIVRAVEYWADDNHPAPDWRAPWTERMGGA